MTKRPTTSLRASLIAAAMLVLALGTNAQPPCVPDLTVTAAVSTETCSGAADGKIRLSAPVGPGNYTFQWDAAAGSQTTSRATGLTAGTYAVTITDPGVCQTATSYSVGTDPIRLEEDIRGGSSSSSPSFLNVFQGDLFFRGSDGLVGTELVQYNGTDALIEDIRPGTAFSSSIPQDFEIYNGELYFRANDGTNGNELWKHDGVSASLVADIRPGSSSSSPFGLTVFNGKLYFRANDGTTGIELWCYDGATATLVQDLNLGSSSSVPSGFTVLGSKMYFDADNGISGIELWSFDGTAMVLVADINAGPGDSNPNGLFAFGSELLFAADNGSNGRELWVYNGTTLTEYDIWLGPIGSAAGQFSAFLGKVYFDAFDATSGSELRSYDGTSVALVADIWPGSGNAAPGQRTLFNGKLYFFADDGTNGFELWSFDGTTALLVADINTTIGGFGSAGSSFPQFFTEFDGRLYFQADDGVDGKELWVLDGSTVSQVKDIRPGSSSSTPSHLTVIGNKMYFAANDGAVGTELWSLTSCVAGPTALCQDITVQVGDTCQAFIDTNDIDNGSSGGSLSLDTIGPFEVGATTVTLTADDGASSSTCTGTVTAQDTTTPTVICIGDTTVTEDSFGCGFAVFNFPTPIASDSCEAPVVVQISGPSSGSQFPVGTTVVQFTATDASGNADTCSFVVMVVPGTPVVDGSLTVQLSGDQGQIGLTDEGDTLRVTATIAEIVGFDALGALFAGTVDPNETLVPGSVHTTPLALKDTFSTSIGVPLSVGIPTGLLANDYDSDPGLFVSLVNGLPLAPVTTALGGTLTVAPDGSLTYTTGSAGKESIPYTIEDSDGNTDASIMVITVNP